MKSLRMRMNVLRLRIRDMTNLAAIIERDEGRNQSEWLGPNPEGVHGDASFEAVLAASLLSDLIATGKAFGLPLIEEEVKRGRDFSKGVDGKIIELASEKLLTKLIVRVLGNAQEDTFEEFIDLRECVAVWRWIKRSDGGRNVRTRDAQVAEFFPKWKRQCEDRLKALPDEERGNLQRALNDYAANQWLYPRVSDDNGELLSLAYGWLFDAAKISEGEGMIFESDVFTRAFGKTLDSQELEALVKRVINAVADAVSDYGLAAMEDMLAEGAQPIPNLPGEVGIIPGKKTGPCPRVLVGVATRTSPRARFGGVQVMRQLRDALITCCDEGARPRTEAAIFIGPLGIIDQIIEESAGDVEGHLRKGVLKVFVPIGVLQDNINVIAWRQRNT